jgi:SH3 domain protein
MKFIFSTIYINISSRNLFFIFILLAFLPIKLLAETVYITDSLLVGLHEEKSIDSAILKVLPTGTVLEVIKRDNDFVHVRDPKGVTGWISNNYLMTNEPSNNENTDASITQSRIRELEAELQNTKLKQAKLDQQNEQIIDTDLAKLKTENDKLNQQIISDKLKSGELQAKLAELRNQISQSGNNNKIAKKIQLLTETNVQLEEKVNQLQTSSKTKISIPDNLNISNPLIVTVIALFIGFLIGIIFMDRRVRKRHGGLRF